MMRKRAGKITAVVTTVFLMAAMMPSFAFAGTYADMTADGEYHFTVFGDSVAGGTGPALKADEEFVKLGCKGGQTEITLHRSPEKCYANLLADMLCNHIYSLPEGSVNFVRNSSAEWENICRDSLFTFSNAATYAAGTEIFLEILGLNRKSDKEKGTDAYYEDVYMKNFCNEKGEHVSNTPFVYAIVNSTYVEEDGSPNKIALGRFFCRLSEIYNEEFRKADIRVIGLGSNDMLMGLTFSVCEILKDDQSGIFNALKDALTGYGIDFSDVDLSKMEDETLVKLLEIAEPAAVLKHADEQVENGLKHYEKILKMMRAEKKDNDAVALVGLYKPYGEEFVSGGKKNVLPVVTGDILDSLSELVESSEYRELSGLNTKAASLSSSVLEDAILSWITKMIYAETGIELSDLRLDKEHLERIIKEFKGDSSEYKELFRKILKNRVSYRAALRSAGSANEAQKALITEMLMEKIKMPLMYALLGTSTGDATEKYNAGIEKLASEYGYRYVDVSDLPADNDPDPHPDLAGHQIIAERVFAALKDVVPPEIKASDIRSLKTSAGKGYLKVRYSAADKGKVTGYTVQYKVKGADKWKKFKDTEKTSVKIKGLKKGKKYAVRVRTYSRNSFETARGKWKAAGAKKVK